MSEMTLLQALIADNIQARAWMSIDTPHPPLVSPDSTPWKVVLFFQGRQMTVNHFMPKESGRRTPSLESVMFSLLIDSYSYEATKDYEKWCYWAGYDDYNYSDPKLISSYALIIKQRDELKRFLGDRYRLYMWELKGEN